MNSPTNALRRDILYPAPNVAPQPKFTKFDIGFTGTLNGMARLVLILLSSSYSSSSSCPCNKAEQAVTTRRIVTVALQIDFMRYLEDGQTPCWLAPQPAGRSGDTGFPFRIFCSTGMNPRMPVLQDILLIVAVKKTAAGKDCGQLPDWACFDGPASGAWMNKTVPCPEEDRI